MENMKKWTIASLLLSLLCVIMLAACSSNTASSGSSAGLEKEALNKQENLQNTEQEQDEPVADVGDEGAISSSEEASSTAEKLEEAEDDTSTETAPENAEQMAEPVSSGTDESAISGEDMPDISREPEIQPESIGTVEIARLSAEDAASFAGKEMTAEPEYLNSLISSDVFYCRLPLRRIEIHPIRQWAEDYSTFTISEEILGLVENTAAEEPFRIYDLFPEGIPINCVVFYLEDGTCGTFALGFNGSGEEHSWETAIYKNLASMNKSLGQQMEDGAVNAILNEYENIVRDYSNDAWAEEDRLKQVNNRIMNGVIPQFGNVYYDNNNEPYCYETVTHFLEIYSYSWKDLGIARLDLNNDGTEELLIGYNFSDGKDDPQPTQLAAAYGVKDGNIQTLFHGWSRSMYYLSEDGSIIHTGSSGAANYLIIKYSLSESEDGLLSLKEEETVVADGTKNPEKPYTYYPEGREITGYDEYGLPVYSTENSLQMDEGTGSEYYFQIFNETIHIDLERLNLLEN